MIPKLASLPVDFARTEKPWSVTTIFGGISVPTTVTSLVMEPARPHETERRARPGCATSGTLQSHLARPSRAYALPSCSTTPSA